MYFAHSFSATIIYNYAYGCHRRRQTLSVVAYLRAPAVHCFAEILTRADKDGE